MNKPSVELAKVLTALEGCTGAEQRALAREQADDVLEGLAQIEFDLFRIRQDFKGLYRTAFKEEAPEYSPEWRKEASA